MLIPYKVDVPMERLPIANWVALALIVAMFPLQVALGEGVLAFVLNGWALSGLFGHMWLHAGIVHALGNMIFLWVFGNAVCAKVGNWAYLPIYVALGRDLSDGADHASPLPLTVGLLFADDPGLLRGKTNPDEVQFFASLTGEVRDDLTVAAELLAEEVNFGVRYDVTDDVNIDLGSVFDEFMWGLSYHAAW